MTCKDCFFYEVCKHKGYGGYLDENGKPFAMCAQNDADMQCNLFKDKSKIIELPCKVGDTVYKIRYNNYDICCDCESLHQGFVDEWCDNDFDIYPEVLDTRKLCPKHSLIIVPFIIKDIIQAVNMIDDFGKLVFFTREQAEQALKERENQ